MFSRYMVENLLRFEKDHELRFLLMGGAGSTFSDRTYYRSFVPSFKSESKRPDTGRPSRFHQWESETSHSRDFRCEGTRFFARHTKLRKKS